MADEVVGVTVQRRSYRSDLREAQARSTRRGLVAAARDLYVERGYAGTTIEAIATRARVSRKTVFTAAGGKAELLKLAWDWALAGDDEPVAMIDRPVVQAMIAERDPAQLVTLWATNLTEVSERVADLHLVLVTAATSEPDIAALSEASERGIARGASSFVSALAAIGGLRTGWSVERAAQTATAFMDPTTYRRLVRRYGWTPADYQAWLVQVLVGTFVDPHRRGSPDHTGKE